MREERLSGESREIPEEYREEAEMRKEVIDKTAPDYQLSKALWEKAQEFRARGLDEVAADMERRVDTFMEHGGLDKKEIEERWREEDRQAGVFLGIFMSRLEGALVGPKKEGGFEMNKSIELLVDEVIRRPGGGYTFSTDFADRFTREAKEIFGMTPSGVEPVESLKEQRKITRIPFRTSFDRVVVWEEEVTDPQLKKAGVEYSPQVQIMSEREWKEFLGKMPESQGE